MSFERKKVKLGHIVDIFTGFPFKSAQYSENPADIKLIRGDNIAQGVLRWDGVKRWPVGETDKLDSFWLKENDVLLAMDRPWIPAGLKFARVYSSDLPCLLVQRVACLRAKNGQDQNFICSLLSTPAFSEYIQNVTTGTAVPHISVKQIKEFAFEKLTQAEEREIGLFHGIIDSRTKLLRETNTTLEAIAQALFKSWFVDFDPVHANAGTQTPSLPDEIQALFPSRLVESPQGLIPEGWEVGAIKHCCERVESGGTPKRSVATYWDGDLPWLSSGEVRNAIVLDTKEKITALGVAKSSAKLWPAGTTVVAMYGATAGEVCFLAKPSTANQACCGLIPKMHAKSFVFFCIRRERENLASKSSGSAQQNLNKGLVESHEVVIPIQQVLAVFESCISPLLEGWIANEKKAETLANLRDSLLPRLISGQLRLPEAEVAFAETIA